MNKDGSYGVSVILNSHTYFMSSFECFNKDDNYLFLSMAILLKINRQVNVFCDDVLNEVLKTFHFLTEEC